MRFLKDPLQGVHASDATLFNSAQIARGMISVDQGHRFYTVPFQRPHAMNVEEVRLNSREATADKSIQLYAIGGGHESQFELIQSFDGTRILPNVPG